MPQSRVCQREYICVENSLTQRREGKSICGFAGETGLGFNRFLGCIKVTTYYTNVAYQV